jgi:hypothetical protein
MNTTSRPSLYILRFEVDPASMSGKLNVRGRAAVREFKRDGGYTQR